MAGHKVLCRFFCRTRLSVSDWTQCSNASSGPEALKKKAPFGANGGMEGDEKNGYALGVPELFLGPGRRSRNQGSPSAML